MDFALREDTNQPVVLPDAKTIVGGMITNVSIKTTRNNQMMAFLDVEDMYGVVEVIVFPRDYEKYQKYLNAELYNDYEVDDRFHG